MAIGEIVYLIETLLVLVNMRRTKDILALLQRRRKKINSFSLKKTGLRVFGLKNSNTLWLTDTVVRF